MINNFLLDVLAAGAILSGILVITSKNPVIAVLFLISAFCNAAGYLLLLGVGFIGISYILVYVGAIAVLFLFVIMMINIRLSDILDVGSQYTKNLPLAITVGFLFVYEIFTIIPVNYNKVSILNLPLDFLNYLNGLLFGSTETSINTVSIAQNPNHVDTLFTNFTQIEALGQGFYTYGALMFIVSSLILLLAMLAPITIVHQKSSNNQQITKTSNPFLCSNSFNRSSLVNTQYNLLNKASYHTSSSNQNLDQTSKLELNPWTVTGLTDGELIYTMNYFYVLFFYIFNKEYLTILKFLAIVLSFLLLFAVVISTIGSDINNLKGLLVCSLVPVKPRRLTKQEREAFSLSEVLQQIIIGLLMGDLNINKDTIKSNARLRFEQGFVHKDYISHLYELFQNYCQSGPVIANRVPDSRTGITYTRITFNTLALPCFNKFYFLFYSNNKKNSTLKHR